MKKKLNKKNLLLYFGYFVALLTLLSLLLLSQATEGSKDFEKLYYPLLTTIVVGIFSLILIVLIYLIKLFINYRKKIPGAYLSVTILQRTLFLAFIPLLFISFFSFKFLSYEFQSSFDEGINDALNNALVLSKKSLDIRAQQIIKENKEVAKNIASYDYIRLQNQLETVRRQMGAYELTVLDENGFIQAFASSDMEKIIPLIPSHEDFARVDREGGIYIIESNGVRFKVRSLVVINKPGFSNYYLQSVVYLPDTVSDLTAQVNRTITERDKLNYLMPQVNQSFILVLILVVLLSGLLLILSSISFAGDMTKPIRLLIQGTKRVSQGNFNNTLLVQRNDDFGTLMNSFNSMTNSLKIATETAEHNRQRVENERAYLETVINSMTSAVMTLDYQYRLQTFNKRAEELINSNLELAIYQNITELNSSLISYKHLINKLIKNYKEENKYSEIEIDIDIDNKLVTFIAAITPLPSTDALHGGYVIIFDDLSGYLQQQKQAAWEEVARRLAHEIKNPLTPIQLAAERLNYKLANNLDDDNKKILSRSVELITNQVKALKDMVNDFSDFAKPTKMINKKIYFNKLVKELFDLYKGNYANIDFLLSFKNDFDTINGNSQVLRQVIHNILKNSIEACETKYDNDKETDYRGRIKLELVNEDNKLLLSISDNGIGLSTDSNKVFEPYVTTKEKGTGLGLAIVKKIIQEHKGTISLKNNKSGYGSIAQITLPLIVE